MSNAAPQARRTGLARQLGLDHNPLRRRIDRLQTCIMAALLAAFLAGAPLITVAAGSWIRAAGLREEHAQQAWHQAPVVLSQTVPRERAFRHLSPPAQARAWWPLADGHARIAKVPAPAGARAGSMVRVWAGPSGPLAGVPLARDTLTARVIATAILVPAVLAIITLGLARAARWLLDRRRLAHWGTAWASVGPRWTRHQ